ncbi:unnamed protein product [Ceutorhynchus assimilis]|uniref:Synembryn-A n=1 Tax=Ceutorhynchus assimilis TaxID=467358 RepID=A0A9N9QJ57_9CUCU|nr:unnamed protein product [Ceutorhynchus assimilis]
MAKTPEIKYQLQSYEPDLSVPTEVNIQNIISGVENDMKTQYQQALINFLVKEHQKFDIEELKVGDTREKLWKTLIKLANKTDDNDDLAVIFTVFRIISRDKASVNKLVTKEWMDLLIRHIGLNDTKFDYSDDTLCKIEEGQKVLWNTLFNSKDLVEASIKNGLLDKLIGRISLYDKVHVPDSIKFYDTKFVFYLTALSKNVREIIVDADGLQLFINALKVILKEAGETPAKLDDQKADIASETLKALFNITLISSFGEKQEAQSRELVGILRNYLMASTINLEKTWQLRNDIVNLLTNIPATYYTELLMPVDESTPLPKSLRFENQNMTVIYEILMFLEAKFNDKSSIGNQLEIYSPILSVLYKAVTAHRSIRKYLRLHILPPLKDNMDKRPEEMNTLRGHLCKLLTTPITQIRDLVAELLFVLCKCNASRMIKYTGYGNAAGLFAQRGLLGGKKDAAEAEFSSESECSETEEYSGKKHLINPVMGCVEKPHTNPMAGMTEEQKEYEAMQLLDKINSLANSGVIQPCRIGSDGKPHPIVHVLQLQERLKLQHIHSNHSDIPVHSSPTFSKNS